MKAHLIEEIVVTFSSKFDITFAIRAGCKMAFAAFFPSSIVSIGAKTRVIDGPLVRVIQVLTIVVREFVSVKELLKNKIYL